MSHLTSFKQTIDRHEQMMLNNYANSGLKFFYLDVVETIIKTLNKEKNSDLKQFEMMGDVPCFCFRLK